MFFVLMTFIILLNLLQAAAFSINVMVNFPFGKLSCFVK